MSRRSSFLAGLTLPVVLLGVCPDLLAQSSGFTVQRLTGLSSTIYPRVLARTGDGRIWFADERFTPHSIGYFTSSGSVTRFPIPCGDCDAHLKLAYVEWITAGPDGNVWFIWTHVGSDGSPLNDGMNSYVSRVTPDGVFTSFPVPTRDAFRRYLFGATGISTIVAGPDGNLWFTEYPAEKIGKITPGGVITEYPLEAFSSPSVIVAGADGNLWFTQPGKGRVGRITPGGALTHFTVGPTLGTDAASPYGLAASGDGDLWFTDRDGKVGRITPAGAITRFRVIDGNSRGLIARGPDGKLYFSAAKQSGQTVTPYVGRLAMSQLSAGAIAPLDDSPAMTLAPLPPGVVGTFQLLGVPPNTIYVTAFEPEGGRYIDIPLKITVDDVEPDCSTLEVVKTPPGRGVAIAAGQQLSLSVKVSGGKPPYEFDIPAGDIPEGMATSYDEATATLGLSGKVFATGSTTIRIAVTDSASPPCSEEVLFHLSIEPAAPDGSSPGNKSKGNRPGSGSSGDPVSTSSGELFFDEVPDLVLGGPLRLGFVRTYASMLASDANVLSALGTNWVHNFDIALRVNGDHARLVLPRGRTVDFRKSGTNWVRNSRSSVPYQLVQSSGGWAVGDPASDLAYLFDEAGRLGSIEDGKGNALTVSRSSGRISEVTDGLGRLLRFSYDSFDRLSSVTDGTRTVQFGYDVHGTLVSASNALGHATAYQYAGGSIRGLLTRKTLPQGNVHSTQTWTSDGRVATQTSGSGRTLTFSYGAASTTITSPTGSQVHTHAPTSAAELTALVDEAGNTVTYQWDGDGRPLSASDRMGARADATHETQSGLPSEVTAPDGSRIRLSYQTRTYKGLTFFAPSSLTLPDGTSESYLWDASGNLLRRTDRAGKQWSYTYNGRGQATTITNPLGGTVTFTWSSDGTLQKASDTDGVEVSFGYDSLRRPVSMSWKDGFSETASLDAVDRITAITDARGNQSTNVWDRNGNLVSTTDAAGKARSFTFDALDRITSATDRTGAVIRAAYGPTEQLAELTSPSQALTRFEYDSRQRLTAFVDPAGKRWQFAHDDEGYSSASTNPLGATERWRRNSMGNEIEWEDALGNREARTYDLAQRLTSLRDGAGRTSTYTWLSDGLPSGIARVGGGAVVWTRDALGNVTEARDPNGRIWRFSYTSMGRLQSVTDPLGRTTSYAYDSRGRTRSVTSADGSATNITVDAVGNVTRLQYGGGPDLAFTYDTLDRLVTAPQLARTYDAEGRVTSTASRGRSHGATYDSAGRLATVSYEGLLTVTYDYDVRGRVASVRDSLTSTVVSFSYDDAARPAGVTRSNGVGTLYTWDPAGRLVRLRHGQLVDLQMQRNGVGDIVAMSGVMPADPLSGIGSDELAFTYDSASQAVSRGSHDARGRMTARGATTLSWDGASRLTRAGDVSFQHDGLGRTIERQSSLGTTSYFYNDAIAPFALVAERNAGGTVRWYVLLPGGQLLYAIEPGAGNRVLHYHFDPMGSTLALTDQAGQVTDAWAYDPWGRVLARSGTSSQPFTWGGRWGVRFEPAIGLHQMGWRWYDAESGRFLTPDPVRGISPETINPYAHARGNPLTFIDPLGLSVKKAIDEWTKETLAGQTGQGWGDVIDDTGSAAGKLSEEALKAVKKAYKAKDLAATGKAAKDFQKIKKFTKPFEKVGKVGGYVSKALSTYEAWNDPNLSTTFGKTYGAGFSLITEFGIDAAEEAQPLFKIFNDVSSIVDNSVALYNTYAEDTVKTPNVAGVIKNGSKVIGAVADSAASQNTNALEKLADQMTSGELGGASAALSNQGIEAFDAIEKGAGIWAFQGWEALNPFTLSWSRP